MNRDPKSQYAKVAHLVNSSTLCFDDPYEEPSNAEITFLRTHDLQIELPILSWIGGKPLEEEKAWPLLFVDSCTKEGSWKLSFASIPILVDPFNVTGIW
jgi:hypothetical protein